MKKIKQWVRKKLGRFDKRIQHRGTGVKNKQLHEAFPTKYTSQINGIA